MTGILQGRGAVVTGSSRGIGRAIALALADAGASVMVTSRKQPACEAVVAEIRERGGTATACASNVSDPGAAAHVIEAARQEFGQIDVLVNNAATNPQFGPLVEADESAIRKVLDVNLLAPLRFIRAVVADGMGETGGSVINIASINGIRPEPLLGAYGASKAALVHMTKTLARELGAQRIRVNAVAPGLIRTDFARALIENDEIRDGYLKTTALGRIGEPEDITGTVVFLASDASAYVTGELIVVDGGSTL